MENTEKPSPKIKVAIILAAVILTAALFTVRYWIPGNDSLQTKVSLVIITLMTGLAIGSIFYKEKRKEQVNYKVLLIGTIVLALITAIIFVTVTGRVDPPL